MKIYHKNNNDQDGTIYTSKNESINRDKIGDGILKYTIATTPYNVEQLYQDHPRNKSTFTQYTNWSLSDSFESYQNRAWKETVILRRNNRVPTKEFVLHFLKKISVHDIIKYRTRIFRILTDNKLESVVNVELTRGKDGKANNTVHFHFLIDDQRNEKVLQKLFETACERQGFVKDIDFSITCRELYDGYRYFDYFTKYGYSDKVILFKKNVTLQKFYQIGKWFMMSKKKIWQDYICERYGSNSDRINKSIIIPDTDVKENTILDNTDESFQSFMSKNFYPLYPNASQRAMLARDIFDLPKEKRPVMFLHLRYLPNETQRAVLAFTEWQQSKTDSSVQKISMAELAEKYNISSKLIQRVHIVSKYAPETMQALRTGTLRLGNVIRKLKNVT